MDFYQYKASPRLSLTPLIDVVFILLLFFMLASNFNRWQQLPVESATAGSGAISTAPVIELSLFADGRLQQSGVPVLGEDDWSWLSSALKQDPNTVFRITPQQDVSVQVLVDTAAELQQRDATRLTFGQSS